jgi:hypothetical protein
MCKERMICVVAALSTIMLLNSEQTATAKPKQGSGAGQCRCSCLAPSGVNGGTLISENVYNSQGCACEAFRWRNLQC